MIDPDLTIDELRAAEARDESVCCTLDRFCFDNQISSQAGWTVVMLCRQFGKRFPDDGGAILAAWRSGALVVRDKNTGQRILLGENLRAA